MTKLFYLTVLDTEDKEKVGILGKIKGQISAMNKRGIDVHFGHFDSKSRFVIENNSVVEIPSHGKISRDLLASVYPSIERYIIENGIKVLYIRLTALDSRSISFYKNIKRHGVCIIIEFYSHNLELETKKTILRNFKNKNYVFVAKKTLSFLINKYYLKQLHKYVDRIVTTTDVYGDMYGIQTINVRNGITPEVMPAVHKTKNDYDLTLISVAMISVWHGYDRVIEGISDYYKAGGKKRILYYVIGDGEERASLENLTKQLNIDSYVQFPGIKTGMQLDQYYEQADVALEMLAGFRRTDGPISSIKMAEYFSKGIPVIYATNEEIYNEQVLQYCLRVPYDDSPIDFENIFAFLKRLNDSPKDISMEMHTIAEEQFDWVVTAKELHDYILEFDSNKSTLKNSK